jgi:MarR family transcriptional regulator, lower aerobic nicotinate degradation pathway regulator
MYSVEKSLGFVFSKISQKMSDLFQDYLDVYSITSKQYGVLLVVSSDIEETQRSVARKLKLDRTTIGQLIDYLERKNLLKRVQSKKDRRAYNLHLTDPGREVVEILWDKMNNVESQVISCLTNEEQKKFVELTMKINESEVKVDE